MDFEHIDCILVVELMCQEDVGGFIGGKYNWPEYQNDSEQGVRPADIQRSRKSESLTMVECDSKAGYITYTSPESSDFRAKINECT